MESLNEMSERIHDIQQQKGFWDQNREVGTLLMLITSELSEALEADRKQNWADTLTVKKAMQVEDESTFAFTFEKLIKDTFQDEIADAFIRLFDFCGSCGIDIESHIAAKLRYNATRPVKHGKAY